MVVGRRTELRWALAGALHLQADAACAPDLATSRLAHPASSPPDAVLLLVEHVTDLGWLRANTRRSGRSAPPVVVALADTSLEGAARSAGAAAVVPLDGSTTGFRRALATVTAPAPVVDLHGARTA